MIRNLGLSNTACTKNGCNFLNVNLLFSSFSLLVSFQAFNYAIMSLIEVILWSGFIFFTIAFQTNINSSSNALK
jgi:hypothetical protein